jgi:glutamate-1-semialdehyde 2,1-aminomutase
LLQQVRKLTAASGVVLIFDEVITGFRFALGGAQQRYGVTPDLTVLGKALGAGLPISGLTGSAEAMAPLTSGTVNLRGTYNGNPLCTAAAVACLDYLSAHAGDCYPRMDGYALAIGEHVRCEARRAGVALTANCVGPCVQLFAGAEAIPTLDDLPKVDRERTVDFTALLLRHGVATLPRGVMYLSTAHGDEEVAGTLRALTAAIDEFSRATSS